MICCFVYVLHVYPECPEWKINSKIQFFFFDDSLFQVSIINKYSSPFSKCHCVICHVLYVDSIVILFEYKNQKILPKNCIKERAGRWFSFRVSSYFLHKQIFLRK